jgi:hypothetical protein
VLHAKQHEREAAPLLAEAVGLRNDTDTRAAIEEVCANANLAPLNDGSARVLVVASESAPLTVFANHAGKKMKYELQGVECVAITPPIRHDDGSVWVRIARDVAPELSSVENDVRYGYVPVGAIRPASTTTDQTDCETLSRGGFVTRARLPCERAALAPEPLAAATAAATVARLWVRSGDPRRGLPWIAAALQLDDGTHAQEFASDLETACAAAFPGAPHDGRHFQIVDWPWDARTAAFIPEQAVDKAQGALATGSCVLAVDASLGGDPEKVLVEASTDSGPVVGLVHRTNLKP